MGLLIVSGGIIGTILGITTFTYFSEIGKISLIISLYTCTYWQLSGFNVN